MTMIIVIFQQFTVQLKNKLYFVLDDCVGRKFHLNKVVKFEEPRASFYTAEIVVDLLHIHALDIFYSDFKLGECSS